MSLIAAEQIEKAIFFIRGQKVMFDNTLAKLYDVPTRSLNQAVKRNIERFPPDFMFQLTWQEATSLRSEWVSLNDEASRSQSVIFKKGNNIKYLPYVFTEYGVAMLSSVLNSPRAIQINIEIMRAFGRLRQMLASHKELTRQLSALEKKYDHRFKIVLEIIDQLMEPKPSPDEKPNFTKVKGFGP